MVTRRKERAATTTVGAGLVGTGGYLRYKGVSQAHALVNKPEPKIGPFKFKDAQLARVGKIPGGSKARALYAGGTIAGLVGTPALAAAVTNHLPARRRPDVAKADDSRTTFLGAGFQGTHDAVRSRVNNAKQHKPAHALAVPIAVGAGAGLAGSKTAHAAFDRIDRIRRGAGKGEHLLRRPGAAIAGVTAAAASLPISNKVLNRVAPEYKVTASGVTRKKKPMVWPSSKATSYEGRASRGADSRAYRQNTVTKNDMGGSDVHVPAPLVAHPQLRRRKIKVGLDAVGGALGTAGVGLLVAGKMRRFAPHAAKIERHAFQTAVASGGVGAAGTSLGVGINRRDIQAQEKHLATHNVHKGIVMPYMKPRHEAKQAMTVVAKAAWSTQLPVGALRAIHPRQSYLRATRYSNGVIRQTRVKASF